jgi:sugar phosphate isomerase/epimerase
VRRADWRDHRTLGTGVIDLPALFTALRGVGYDGLLQLELEEPDQEPALVASKCQLERLIAAG